MTSKSKASQGDAPVRVEVAPGDMLAGKFRVERVVGRGGMGVVVEATNVQLDQKVALKLLAHGKGGDAASVERFNGEARAAARLRSEHVARVYDVGRDTIHGPFIVMEMLEGKTLADLVVASGRVPLHRAVEYVIDACEGLAEAHARGIVHQDVKPANLFLVTGSDGRPSVKLLDFGIATMRSKEREEGGGKSSHASLGTPAYLSPEQLRGSSPVDHRADVWSLGCVLYELLVADRPFRATRFTELITKIMETAPHPYPADLELPAPVADAIARCLEKDPEKRFGSTGRLALALLPFARPRARLAAERAIAHLRSAGLEPGLEMPSSLPPPSTSSGLDLPPPSSLRAPAVPSFSGRPARAAASTAPAPPMPEAPPTPNAKQTRSKLLFLVPLAVMLVVAAVVFLLRPAEPTPTRPGEPRKEAALDAAAPAATHAIDAPPPRAATSELPDSSAATAATVVAPRGRGSAAKAARSGTPPSATASPKPSSNESEIRYQR